MSEFTAELIGTMFVILLGNGVVAMLSSKALKAIMPAGW